MHFQMFSLLNALQIILLTSISQLTYPIDESPTINITVSPVSTDYSLKNMSFNHVLNNYLFTRLGNFFILFLVKNDNPCE